MILDAQTRQFAPITFSIGSTFFDNILEGQEKFALRISQSNSFQVGQNGSVEIQIHDATGMWTYQNHFHVIGNLIHPPM